MIPYLSGAGAGRFLPGQPGRSLGRHRGIHKKETTDRYPRKKPPPTSMPQQSRPLRRKRPWKVKRWEKKDTALNHKSRFDPFD